MKKNNVTENHYGDDDTAEISNSQLEHLRSNTLLRCNKHSAVYVIPVSPNNSKTTKLYVFEPLDQTQKWFFERVMWPKLRKSPRYDREFRCGKHHCVSFHQDYLDGSTEDEDRVGAITIAKRLFQQYLNSDHALLFQDEPLPRKYRSNGSISCLTIPVPSATTHEDGAGTLFENLPRRRRRTRALPRDRDQDMIVGWARMLAQEVDLDVTRGASQPGGKFLLQLAHPQRLPPIHGQDTLQMMIQKQCIWAERLARMVSQLPGALQKQQDLRDQAWLEGLPWVQRWFVDNRTSNNEHNGGVSPDDDELRQSTYQWGKAMRWMTNWSFDMFEGKSDFSYGLDDWLQCITSNVAIHQWSLDEEEKQLGQAKGPNAILVRMVKTQTRWELTRGMEPLLGQIHDAAETEAHEWKSLCQRPATKDDVP
ncbi:hypothetical protein PG999_010305 [Apiospora kogelbergensis]|uniref:Uncharacterized protein n=1 Tax=Apiospora kogelbergensis TaxID=1337665 RepID=A0AAW0QC76_9PEZI